MSNHNNKPYDSLGFKAGDKVEILTDWPWGAELFKGEIHTVDPDLRGYADPVDEIPIASSSPENPWIVTADQIRKVEPVGCPKTLPHTGTGGIRFQGAPACTAMVPCVVHGIVGRINCGEPGVLGEDGAVRCLCHVGVPNE